VADYENDLYGDAEVSMEDGHLALRFHATTSPLEYFQYDTFLTRFDRSEGEPTRLTFAQNADGNISGFELAGAHFQRQKKPASKPPMSQ
jgi:hypothetical protein